MICSKICFIASFLGKKMKSQPVRTLCPKSSEKYSDGGEKWDSPLDLEFIYLSSSFPIDMSFS